MASHTYTNGEPIVKSERTIYAQLLRKYLLHCVKNNLPVNPHTVAYAKEYLIASASK